ncbi:MAG: D-alanine--D-alanine ligase [Elusimicrobia bacterium]|nr:D-alanine--D-alanine ligase [Elusimicrobiota bacterium]
MNIAVFFGGKSVEHEVSIQSAKNIITTLKEMKNINIFPIFVDKNGGWHLSNDNLDNIKIISGIRYDFTSNEFIYKNKKIKIDVAFSMIHGNTGEDGKLQGFFETADIAYTGCDLLSSAITMNKKLSKTIAEREGISVLDDITVSINDFKRDRDSIISAAKRMKMPLFVKPNSLGSSVGVRKVKSISELTPSIENAFMYEDKIMIEKGVDSAREIVCGLLGNNESPDASPCGEIRVKGKHEFYDYNAKYTDENGMELLIPAEINLKTAEKIQLSAKKIFKALGCYGFARADFLMDPKDNKIYFCEINTIPGFTSHSLFPKLFEKKGIAIKEQVKKILNLAIERKSYQSNFKKSI